MLRRWGFPLCISVPSPSPQISKSAIHSSSGQLVMSARRNRSSHLTQPSQMLAHLLTIARRFRNLSAPFLLYLNAVEQRFRKPRILYRQNEIEVNAMFFVFN